jgi:hypothetical protein
MAEEPPAHPGLGERGWWPISNVTQKLEPIPSGLTFAKLLDRGKGAWNLFNKFDPAGKPITINSTDKYGTKNSGLWGVNLELQFEKSDDKTVGLTLCGLHTSWPAGLAMFDPEAKVGRELPFLNRRSAQDYDCFPLEPLGGGKRRFSIHLAPAGSSVFPVGLIFEPSGARLTASRNHYPFWLYALP